jgi:hypothetical protein
MDKIQSNPIKANPTIQFSQILFQKITFINQNSPAREISPSNSYLKKYRYLHSKTLSLIRLLTSSLFPYQYQIMICIHIKQSQTSLQVLQNMKIANYQITWFLKIIDLHSQSLHRRFSIIIIKFKCSKLMIIFFQKLY